MWTEQQYDFTRKTIAYRRFERKALADGYVKLDPVGGHDFHLFNAVCQRGQPVTDVRISPSGDMLYLRLGPSPWFPNTP